MWEKIVSFSLLDTTHGFSTPQRKYPSTTPQKNIFKPMEDRATGFQNFYLPPLKKKRQNFSFLCFWIFFLSDSYISVSIQNSLLESRDHVYLLLLLSFESSKELN